MKIKQIILALIMVLVVSESQASMIYSFPGEKGVMYLEDPMREEEPKTQLCKEQAERFFQGENPPFSLDKLSVNRVAWFMNRMPEDRIVAAVDFYLSHLGIDGGENPVLGFRHAGRFALFHGLNALRILSPGDYQCYFDYALQIVGPRTGNDSLDSMTFVEAFEYASLFSSNAIGVPVPKSVIEVPIFQLQQLRPYFQLRQLNLWIRGQEEINVFRELARAQIYGGACFLFLKALFELPCTKELYPGTMAQAARSYCSENPKTLLTWFALDQCMNKLNNVYFRIEVWEMPRSEIKAQLQAACDSVWGAQALEAF